MTATRAAHPGDEPEPSACARALLDHRPAAWACADRFRRDDAKDKPALAGTRIAKAPTLAHSGLLSRGHQMATLLKLVAGQDLNLRPSGYEPDELPDCSTPRLMCESYIILKCCAAHRLRPGFWRAATPVSSTSPPRSRCPRRTNQPGGFRQTSWAAPMAVMRNTPPCPTPCASPAFRRSGGHGAPFSARRGASMSRLPLRQTMLAPARSRNVREAPLARSRRVVCGPARNWGS